MVRKLKHYMIGLVGVATLASALLFPLTTAAAFLYGATGSGGVLSDLYTINTSTGAGTFIGRIGFNVSGIAFDPTTGRLYGLSGGAETGAAELITINTTTGAGTLVGTVTGPVTDRFPDITFDAAGSLYAWTEERDALVRIDKTTAAVTFLGPTLGSAVTGLAFSNAGRLFREVAGTLSTIDPITGALVSTIGSAGRLVGLGMDFDQNDTLYAIERRGPGPGGARALVTVNTSTGAATTIGGTVAGLEALAFQKVPEPASLLLLGIGALGLAWSRRRKS